jgi:hypothetical protein
MEPGSGPSVNCPSCGEANPAAEERCHACSRLLTIYIGPAKTLPTKFGLGSLMVLVAAIGLGLGIFRVSPLVGILFLALVIPAMIRTSGVASQRAEDERKTTFEDVFTIFLTSLGLMCVVLIFTFLPFLGICFTLALIFWDGGTYARVAAVGISGTMALSIGGTILRRGWRYRD